MLKIIPQQKRNACAKKLMEWNSSNFEISILVFFFNLSKNSIADSD